MNPTIAQYKYFVVQAKPRAPKRKTRDYDVISRQGYRLAGIDFYPQWRQHVLIPEEGTVWSSGCLSDIIDAMQQIREEHK